MVSLAKGVLRSANVRMVVCVIMLLETVPAYQAGLETIAMSVSMQLVQIASLSECSLCEGKGGGLGKLNVP